MASHGSGSWRLVLMCALVLAPTQAKAFCRKRAIPLSVRAKHNSKAPNPADRVNKQCTTTCEDDQFEDFKPYPYLYWPNACTGFSVSTTLAGSISAQDATAMVISSFSQWSGARCTESTGDARPSIDLRDLGTASCPTPGYDRNGGPNQNLIVFRGAWDTVGQGKSYADTIGLTVVTYEDDGRIVDADMQFNMQVNPALEGEPVPEGNIDPVSGERVGGRFDLRSIVTHELGHFIGFVHSCDENAVMFWNAGPGETKKRFLSNDDLAAVCSTYLPGGERALDASHRVAARPCDPIPAGGFTDECQAAPSKCSMVEAPTAGGLASFSLLAAWSLVAMARRSKLRAIAVLK